MNNLKNSLVLRRFWYVNILTISTLLLLLLCLPKFANAHQYVESSQTEDFAYSPDKNRFAIAAYDEIWLFDAHTYEKRLTLMNDTSGFGGRYSIVAFSPDGKKIASVNGNSEEIQIWNPITGEMLLSFFGHTEDNSSIMFSPNGAILASDDTDNNIRLWDADTGQLQKIIEIDSDYLFSFTFSPDGKTIATTGYQQILLWDVETGQLRKTLKGPADKVYSVAFSPDGNTIASSGFQEILLWDPHTGKKLNTLAGHKGSVESIAFSPDGRILAGGSYQEILLWDVQKAQHLKTLSKPNIYDAGVNSIAFSPDGQKMASLSEGNWGCMIQLWDVKTGQHKLTIGEDWRHNNPAIGYSYPSVFSQDISKAAFIDDFSQNFNYAIIICKFPIHELRSVKPPSSPIRGRITSLRKVHETPVLYKSPVKAIRFSQDGKTAVSISRNDIALWNADSGKHKKTLKDNFAQIYSVAISPDGKILASGNGWNNSEIRLWNIGNGRLKSVLTGHTHWVDT
ncbi:WD40 repeat domain-containing protein, partial [Candidatus Poribacteria bacterium]|nr:WD40 repeat domain-containing protein [Candidatus Poribacteria bacterium]